MGLGTNPPSVPHNGGGDDGFEKYIHLASQKWLNQQNTGRESMVNPLKSQKPAAARGEQELLTKLLEGSQKTARATGTGVDDTLSNNGDATDLGEGDEGGEPHRDGKVTDISGEGTNNMDIDDNMPYDDGQEETEDGEGTAACSSVGKQIASSNDDHQREDGDDEFDATTRQLLHLGPAEESDDGQDDDRSDYSADESARRQKKEKCRSRGLDVSDTEEDDLDAEQEMLEDVVPESEAPYSAPSKGKGRAVDPQSEEDVDNNEDTEAHGQYTPGPLSAEAREEAQVLGAQTRKAAKSLVAKYNKPYLTIMRAAGLNIQTARQRKNFSNQFKTWYAAKVPIKPGREYALLCTSFSTELYTETFHEYRSEIYASYQSHLKLFGDDEEGALEARKIITDWCDAQTIKHDNYDESTKSMVAYMRSAKGQFTDLVSFLTLTFTNVLSVFTGPFLVEHVRHRHRWGCYLPWDGSRW
jgi:hypothetical protein